MQKTRTDECCIFERFMDFLSYITVRDRTSQDVFADIEPQCDIIVLNTVACLKRAIGQLSHYRAIHCFLDNDEISLSKSEQIMKKMHPLCNSQFVRRIFIRCVPYPAKSPYLCSVKQRNSEFNGKLA